MEENNLESQEPNNLSDLNDNIEENLSEDIQEPISEEISSDIDIQEDIQDTLQEKIIEESSFDSKETQTAEELITVRPVKFQEFEQVQVNRAVKKNLDILQDVQMHISVELGRAKSSIKDVMEIEKGSIVELEKIAGEQVEIYVNEKLVAKGEVMVIEDKFGVRVTSTNLNNQHQ